MDGGITLDNIGLLTAAGAKEFVAGSTIFKSNDYAEIIQKLRQKGIQANA